MYQNPTDAIQAVIGDLGARGDKVPDAFTIAHQQQGVALNAGGSWIISTPGLLRSNINERSSVANLQGESSHRNYTTRRMTPTSGAFQMEQTDDGRTLFHVMTDRLLEKASISSDPITIVTFNDWQNGSPTAQPDLQVKLLDYVGTKVLPETHVIFNYIGDIIQGNNFKGSAFEKKRLGLVEIDDQIEFVSRFHMLATADISKSAAENIDHVGIVPGNHEWNSGFVQNGAVHTQWLVSLMREFFLKRGIDPDKQKDFISFYRQWQGGPDHVIGWTGFENVAGYGVMLQHVILEKGAKGGGGRPPIYEANTLNQGVGSLVKSVDIQEFGHWHHDMLGLFNGKVAVVAPSLAGLSSYEWLRGYRPHMGALLMHLGGGKAPVFEFLSPKTLYEHKVQGKYFSEKHLRSLGFKDDRHFDPEKHGFMTKKGGIQKALWALKEAMLDETQAKIAG